MCGARYRDRFKDVKISFDHNSPSLTLRLTSNLNERANNESFGFNNVDIIYCDQGECKSNYV